MLTLTLGILTVPALALAGYGLGRLLLALIDCLEGFSGREALETQVECFLAPFKAIDRVGGKVLFALSKGKTLPELFRSKR